MLKSLPQLPETEILVPNTKNPNRAIEYINYYIDKTKCENMSVDISFMNVIDACHVSTLCSTNHFIKYPEGKINWIVSSKLTKDIGKSLDLGNTEYYFV